MAIKRQSNFLGNQRVDVPHLRLMESAVAADFQALSGTFMSGSSALVAVGALVLDTGMVGQPANTLVLRMANAVLLHGTATEPGAIFTAPASQADDTLNSANAAVVGSFTPGVTNYISIDLVRTADTTTQDTVVFRSSSTGNEFPQVAPLGRVLNYTINISTSNFGVAPTLCPVAKVVTDASNNIVSIEDCRQMFFRLGSGGTTPDSLATYAWGVRDEALSTSLFTGGDKDFTSQYAFNRAIQHRMWELGGGEHWYSPATDRTVKQVWDNTMPSPAPGATTNFWWDGTDLTWNGIFYVFGESTATSNIVAPALAATPGLTDLIDGDVIYVDLDRTTDGATIQPVKATRAWLLANQSALPGTRHILAWRYGTKVYVGDDNLDVTAASSVVIPAASTVALGGVVLNHASYVPANPKVAVVNASDWAVVDGVDRLIAGILSIGTAAANALSFAQVGVTSTFFGDIEVDEGVNCTQTILNGDAGYFVGNGTGDGVGGWGGSTDGSVGLKGQTLAANGDGVYGIGKGTGYGVYGSTAAAGATLGVGVYGDGTTAATNGTGVEGVGLGTGSGVHGLGGATGHGVYGEGADNASSYGVRGVAGTTGVTLGIGVYGDGTTAATNGTGVKGVGLGTGSGVHGLGGATGHGVYGDGGTGTGHGVHGVAPISGGAALAYAVWGDGTTATTNGTGVYGAAKGTGHGVIGAGASNAASYGVFGSIGANGDKAVYGDGTGATTNGTGVYGIGKGTGNGVCGEHTTGTGVRGIASTGVAVGGSASGVGGTGGSFAAIGLDGTGIGASSSTGWGAAFQGNATKSALHLNTVTAHPTTRAAGDIWFRSDLNALCFAIDATTVITLTTST